MSKTSCVLDYLKNHPPKRYQTDRYWERVAATCGTTKDYARKVRQRFKVPFSGENDLPERLTTYLAEGHTLDEICKRFYLNEQEAKKLLVPIHGDKELFVTEDSLRRTVYLYLPKPSEPLAFQKRAWTYAKQKDGQPYLLINFRDLDFKKIKLAPLSDIHIGHVSHLAEKLESYIQYIVNNPHVFTFINGDFWEFANKLSVGSGVYEQNMMPNDQIAKTREILARIWHKVLWIIPGNHEDRTMKTVGVDVLKALCDSMNIPYFNEPVYVDMLWKGRRWSLFAQHGASSSQTKGGKMNAAGKPRLWQEYVQFIVMGHVHDKIVNQETIIVRNTREFKLEFKKQYVVVLPAFMGYFNTYGARNGYAPPSWGSIALELYPNGDYHATT